MSIFTVPSSICGEDKQLHDGYTKVMSIFTVY